jgi:hypothetical protein
MARAEVEVVTDVTVVTEGFCVPSRVKLFRFNCLCPTVTVVTDYFQTFW